MITSLVTGNKEAFKFYLCAKQRYCDWQISGISLTKISPKHTFWQ